MAESLPEPRCVGLSRENSSVMIIDIEVPDLATVLASPQAWSQNEDEGVMVLESRAFDQHEESLVRFNHYLHENIFR